MDRKIICIDLGHCETTSAYARPLSTDEEKYEVRHLVAERGKDMVISTQMSLTNEQMALLRGNPRPDYALLQTLGDIRIGNKLPPYILDGENFSYFKVAPKFFDKPYDNSSVAMAYGITYAMLMACFVYALTDGLLTYNPGDLEISDRSNLHLAISCPTTSDWNSDDAMAEYGTLVKNATGAYTVQVVPEYRATIYSAIEKYKNAISLINGAVVFDFGSSTADCTYVLLGRKIIKFSCTLGASEIERQMAMTALRGAMSANDSFEVDEAAFVDCVDYLKFAKEAYYSGKFPPDGRDMVCAFSKKTDGKRVKSLFTIDKQSMDEVTRQNKIQIMCDSKTPKTGSWQELCAAFFQEAKRRIFSATYNTYAEDGTITSAPCSLSTIVLTGGASRMEFIHALCEQAFPGIEIFIDANPSYIVSDGLGSVAVSDRNLIRCKEDTKKYIINTPGCSVAFLRNKISDALFERICTIVEDRTWIWANRPTGSFSLKTLKSDIQYYMVQEDVIQEHEKICSQVIRIWINNLSDALGTSVRAQVPRLYCENVAWHVQISEELWTAFKVSTLASCGVNASPSIDMIDLSGAVHKTVYSTELWSTERALVPIRYLLMGLSNQLNGILSQSFARSIKLILLRSEKFILQELNRALEQEMKRFTDYITDYMEDFLIRAFEIVTLRRFED